MSEHEWPAEVVEKAARAMAIRDEHDGCFERIDAWNALDDWERDAYPGEYPGMDLEDAEMWRKHARAALSAVSEHVAAEIAAAEKRGAAKALRDAADVQNNATVSRVSDWLNHRADQIDGEGHQ